MQSGYHNLPTIEGLDQHDGPDYRARAVETSFGEAKSHISMELSGAYPLKDFKTDYTREIFFDKLDNRILLKDTTNAENVVLNFITYEKPEAEGNRIRIGALAKAAFEGAEVIKIETLPITDARLRTAWDHDLYRIRLQMTAREFLLEIL